MHKIKFKKRGESLIEVLVAVGILTTVLITSFILVNRGLSSNISVKNKIIAINIAREGVEGMRNIRDTNWLKYSGDKRGKWLYKEFSSENNGTGYINNGVNESFAIDFENSEFTLFNPEEQGKLDLQDNVSDWSKYRLYKKISNRRYTHEPGITPNQNIPTIFYRQLILKSEKPPECDDTVPTDNYECSSPSRLHVVSRVQWREPLIAGSEVVSQDDLIGTISMETYLYDYLSRNEF